MCKTAYELFYSSIGQHTSVGNYWNDPHHQSLFFNYSVFLPYVNNELISSHSTDFKYGLTKLKKVVLIGGPDDGVITPWQSRYDVLDMFVLEVSQTSIVRQLIKIKINFISHFFSQFGYYDVNETVVEVRDRDVYKRDLIGLQTLDKEKKLMFVTVPNTTHFDWHRNVDIIDKHILPHLD